jgi:hypothetical protein
MCFEVVVGVLTPDGPTASYSRFCLETKNLTSWTAGNVAEVNLEPSLATRGYSE